MAAEVKFISGPHRQKDGSALFWVKVGQSTSLRPVTMTRQQLISFSKNALSILEGDYR
jgi:hypothetical protein